MDNFTVMEKMADKIIDLFSDIRLEPVNMMHIAMFVVKKTTNYPELRARITDFGQLINWEIEDEKKFDSRRASIGG